MPSPENLLEEAIKIAERGDLRKPDQIAELLGIKFVASRNDFNTTIYAPSDPAAASIVEYRTATVIGPASKEPFIGFIELKVPKSRGCLDVARAKSRMNAHAMLFLNPPFFMYKQANGASFRITLGDNNLTLSCFGNILVQEGNPL